MDGRDVDGNGVIIILDVVLSAKLILDIYRPTEEELARMDLNDDGRLAILDAIFIVNAVLGG